MVLNILIAEDNKFTAVQYKKYLESKGFNVTVFTESVRCLEKFKSEFRYKKIVLKESGAPYDYVLLDYDMPKMTGAEIATKVRKLSPKQKIIFLSAYGQKIIENQENRRDEFLQIIQKPFSLEFLYEKIKPKNFTTLARSQVNDMLTITQSPETIR
jgi:CheY-like chemotaxis protein